MTHCIYCAHVTQENGADVIDNVNAGDRVMSMIVTWSDIARHRCRHMTKFRTCNIAHKTSHGLAYLISKKAK